jgi:hypothetical protein
MALTNNVPNNLCTLRVSHQHNLLFRTSASLIRQHRLEGCHAGS